MKSTRILRDQSWRDRFLRDLRRCLLSGALALCVTGFFVRAAEAATSYARTNFDVSNVTLTTGVGGADILLTTDQSVEYSGHNEVRHMSVLTEGPFTFTDPALVYEPLPIPVAPGVGENTFDTFSDLSTAGDIARGDGQWSPAISGFGSDTVSFGGGRTIAEAAVLGPSFYDLRQTGLSELTLTIPFSLNETTDLDFAFDYDLTTTGETGFAHLIKAIARNDVDISLVQIDPFGVVPGNPDDSDFSTAGVTKEVDIDTTFTSLTLNETGSGTFTVEYDNLIAGEYGMLFAIESFAEVGAIVPEPGTALLAGFGLVGMLLTGNRRRRNR